MSTLHAYDETLDAMFARSFGSVPRPKVPTTTEFCGLTFPRDPQDIARDRWMAEQLPVAVAELAGGEASLSLAMMDALLPGVPDAMRDAFRADDDAELGRLFRIAVMDRLACIADSDVEREAWNRYPESE